MAGTLTITTLSDGTNSTSCTNVINGAKVWVNFNGTSGASIRASYNVSSVTYNGTGAYTVNFTNALADENYAAMGTMQSNAGGGVIYALDGGRTSAMAQPSTSCQIILNTGSPSYDSSVVSFAAFR